MFVVAGPSGSGKSVAFPRKDFTAQEIDYFNIDERIKELNGGSSQNVPDAHRLQANAELREFASRHLDSKQSFAFETTLRTDFAIRLAAAAREASFDTDLRYIAPESVDINIERVRIRAYAGGHSAPEWKIREIHRDSVNNVPEAIRRFNSVLLIDNTRTPEISLTAQNGRIVSISPNVPQWLENVLANTEFNLIEVRREIQNRGHGFGL